MNRRTFIVGAAGLAALHASGSGSQEVRIGQMARGSSEGSQTRFPGLGYEIPQ